MAAQPNSSAAGIKSAHLRWHVNKGVVSSKCALCRLAHPELSIIELENLSNIQKSTDVLPLSETTHQEAEFAIVTKRLANEKCIPYDYKNRMLSFASLGMTVEQVASAFDVDVPTFQQWMKDAYNGRTWEQLLETAPETVANKVLATCISKALRGDIKFLTLLEEWGKIPGFAKLRETVAPSIHVKVDDFSKVSSEDLQRERHRLIEVIDAPKRLSAFVISKTLTSRAATKQEIDEFYAQEVHYGKIKNLDYDGHATS